MKGSITRRSLLGNIAVLGAATATGKAFANTHRFSPVQLDFTDPYLELVRLLKEGAEIEHDLMLQYLYAAFSIKPAYAELVGAPVPNATTLMGVIIQEMQHLGDVNRLLVELDAAPVLTRLDYPYAPDVYPFPFELSSLSSVSLAKFVYCEADPVRLGHVRSVKSDSVRLDSLLKTSFGGITPVNHVGKLYDAIVE